MMKQRLHLWRAVVVMLAGLGTSTAAWAEGSRELTPNTTGTTANLTLATNTRAGYLIHDSNAPNPVSQLFLKPNAPDEQRMYVRLKPGEILYYGVHRTPTTLGAQQNNLIITVKWVDEFGVQRSQATTLATATGTNPARALLDPALAGVIDNAAQNQAGPKTAANPNGYDALSITYPASSTGTRDYWVEFTQVGEASLSDDAQQSYYDFWDFTVKNAADQEQKGRLFSKFWAFTSGRSATSAYENRLSATFNMFTLIPSPTAGQYYVKQVELAGMRPLNFFFVANAKGLGATSTDFTQSRKSKTGQGGYAEYINFVNDPDISIWPSAPVPVFSRTAQFFCNPIDGSGSGAFTTISGESGSVNVLIDLNNNNIEDGQDVLLTQTVQANVAATVRWNGKNKAGVTVTPGPNVKINLSFTSTGTPVNYPLYDAEGNDDGLRIQNVRPSSGGNTFFDRLYWDDTDLSLTLFPDNAATPENERVRLDGANSTPGVHKWGDATNDVGNNVTLNTWTYGFITPIDQIFTYEFECDYDGDGISDATDLDDDNDGILDLTEAFGVNPQLLGPNGVLVYLDAAYVHPVLGAYRDLNRDGINDIFDIDKDGIPNHFDLDADGDGLPDAVEAGITTLTWTGNTISNTSLYNTSQARFTGTGNSVGANGVPNAVEARTVNPTEVNTVRYNLLDTDNDLFTANSQTVRNYNFLDIDSDNDGIADNLEAQTTAAYRAPSGLDTDNDGLDNAYDLTPGTGQTPGTAIVISDKDNDGQADMLDLDSDNDNIATKPLNQQTADWTEGFDIGQDGTAGGELLVKARQFAANNREKMSYYPVLGPASGVSSPFFQDTDGDGTPNFLDPQSPFYHDDNFNGLVDLYDPAYGGSSSVAPRRGAGQADADFRTAGVLTPLPVELIGFAAKAAGRDALVTWATASEKDNAYFEVERSTDAVTFMVAGKVEGKGTSSRSDYALTDKGVGASAGTIYYRLRQVDQDGKKSFSDVQVVRFDGRALATLVTVYPSPTTESATLDLLALPKATYLVEIIGADGRKMARFETQGGRETPLMVATYAKGTYLVRVSGQGQSYLVKLLKN